MRNYIQFIKELILFERKKVLLIVFCCIITIVSFLFFIRFLFFPYTGLITDIPEVIINNNNELLFSPRASFSPSIEAGLIPDKDQILRINGKYVSDIKSLIDMTYSLDTFAPVKIEVNRENTGILEYFIQPKLMFLQVDWICTFLLVITIIATGFIILIFLHNQIYYPFVLCLFLYLLSISVKAFHFESLFSMSLVHLGNLSFFMLSIFALYYPYTRFKSNIRILILFIIILFYMMYLSSSIFIYFRWTQTKANLWYQFLILIEKIKNTADITSALFFFFLLFHGRIKSRSKKERKQIEWILAGFIIAFSPYFFFEHLPFIIGNLINEKVTLGSFAYVFMCPFPVSFLIGAFDPLRKRFTYYIPKYLYFLISILFVLFFFLLTAKYIHLYLIKNYGFSQNMAYLCYAFIFLLVVQPIIICGMRIIEKIIYSNKYKKSLNYVSNLESENIELKQKYSFQLQYNKSIHQADKLKDISEIIEGIYSTIGGRSNKISKSLLTLNTKIEHIMTILSGSNFIEEIEFKEKKSDVLKLLNYITKENIHIKDFLDQMKKPVQLKPSLPLWIRNDYIIQKIIAEIKKTHPHVPINIVSMSHDQIYCCPSDIIYALTHLISYLLKITSSQNDEIIITSTSNKIRVMIEVEFRNTGIGSRSIKNIFIPFKHLQKQEKVKFGLYISKILIEKNSGSIDSTISEKGIHFIIAFPV